MNLQSRRLRTTLCIGLFLGAFVVTHTPPPPPPSRPPINDKFMHFCGSLLLAMAAIWRGLTPGKLYPLRMAGVWLLVLAAYAAFDELTQPIMGRSCEFYDWVADVCGYFVGIVIMVMLHRHVVVRAA